MKENKDELIQKLLDENSLEAEKVLSEMAEDADVKAYNLLYDTLRQETDEGLSYSFRPSVLRRIELERKRADDTSFYWLFSIIFSIGIGAVVTMIYMLKDVLNPFWAILDVSKVYIIILIIITILLSNIVDQRLINNRTGVK